MKFTAIKFWLLIIMAIFCISMDCYLIALAFIGLALGYYFYLAWKINKDPALKEMIETQNNLKNNDSDDDFDELDEKMDLFHPNNYCLYYDIIFGDIEEDT